MNPISQLVIPDQNGAKWNRCDICGRFISTADFDSKKASRRMITPDSDYSIEDYETLCRNHKPFSSPVGTTPAIADTPETQRPAGD